MPKGTWILALLFALLALTVTIQLASSVPVVREPPREPLPWRDLYLYLWGAKTVLASVNTVLLTYLLIVYIDIYRKTGSEFSLGLVIFSIALLLYALTSNPLLHRFAGFRGSGLGPFTMLPDLFTCIASVVLLYLSRQ
jgi:hypothetical protein